MIATAQGRAHIAALVPPLARLEEEVERLTAWGTLVAEACRGGGRLLVVGNGGSAAEAQHLTAELVGRFEDEREPLSAVALHAETSSLTAIANDYGGEAAFARQVQAHGPKETSSWRSRRRVRARTSSPRSRPPGPWR